MKSSPNIAKFYIIYLIISIIIAVLLALYPPMQANVVIVDLLIISLGGASIFILISDAHKIIPKNRFELTERRAKYMLSSLVSHVKLNLTYVETQFRTTINTPADTAHIQQEFNAVAKEFRPKADIIIGAKEENIPELSENLRIELPRNITELSLIDTVKRYNTALDEYIKIRNYLLIEKSLLDENNDFIKFILPFLVSTAIALSVFKAIFFSP